MDRRIEVVLATIEREYAHPWTTEALARLVNLSPSRLRHLFKQRTGQTPTQILKGIRVRKAEALLCTTFLSVKEIANTVGFLSASHFVKDFKKTRGASPTTFRKRFGPTSSPRRKQTKTKT